jgi:hypothetical protein
LRRGRPASVRAAAAIVSALLCGGCASSDRSSTVLVIDLLHEFARAEKRPADGGFAIAEHTVAGVRHTGIAVPPASRLIWTARLPARGWLRTSVTLLPARTGDATVSFRIGISDDRLYERLAEERVTVSRGRDSAWIDLAADLSPYAGRKWSLFYRPDSVTWRLVLSTDRVAGEGRAFWGSPRVVSDLDAAREWQKRAAPPATAQ